MNPILRRRRRRVLAEQVEALRKLVQRLEAEDKIAPQVGRQLRDYVDQLSREIRRLPRHGPVEM